MNSMPNIDGHWRTIWIGKCPRNTGGARRGSCGVELYQDLAVGCIRPRIRDLRLNIPPCLEVVGVDGVQSCAERDSAAAQVSGPVCSRVVDHERAINGQCGAVVWCNAKGICTTKGHQKLAGKGGGKVGVGCPRHRRIECGSGQSIDEVDVGYVCRADGHQGRQDRHSQYGTERYSSGRDVDRHNSTYHCRFRMRMMKLVYALIERKSLSAQRFFFSKCSLCKHLWFCKASKIKAGPHHCSFQEGSWCILMKLHGAQSQLGQTSWHTIVRSQLASKAATEINHEFTWQWWNSFTHIAFYILQ